MRAHLETICATEQIAVEPAVLPLVVRAGGGSARDSLSLLDQLLAGAGDEGVTYARAVALLGVTDTALLDTMVEALAVNDGAAAYGAINSVVEAGHDPRRFAADLLDRFRDLMLIEAVPDAAVRHLIDATTDDAETLAKQASSIGAASLARFAEIVHSALIEMRGATSARLVLELLCARMLLPDASADAAALLQRVERLERRMTAGPSAASAPSQPVARPPAPPSATAQSAPAAPSAPATPSVSVAPSVSAATGPSAGASLKPKESASAESSNGSAPNTTQAPTPATTPITAPVTPAPTTESPGTIDSAAMRRLWPAVLDRVKQRSRRTRALLDNAQVGGVKGNDISLLATSATLAKMIGDDSNVEHLRAALTEEIGGIWTVQVGVDGSGGQPSTAAEMEEAMPSPPPAEHDVMEMAGSPMPQAARTDPEAEALQLLRSTLDARPLD
jgi:DNA polymerase-3 subunit gamma/tau